jgi:hypothetical protein
MAEPIPEKIKNSKNKRTPLLFRDRSIKSPKRRGIVFFSALNGNHMSNSGLNLFNPFGPEKIMPGIGPFDHAMPGW